jgi:phosphotransferase system HPr-like phosphotransfer protein
MVPPTFRNQRSVSSKTSTGALHARPQALLVQRICDFGTAAVLLHYPDATHTRLSSLSRSAALSCLEGESAERLAPACEPG